MNVYSKNITTTKYEAICKNNEEALIEYSKTSYHLDKNYPVKGWITNSCNKTDDCSYTECTCKHGTKEPDLKIIKIISKE